MLGVLDDHFAAGLGQCLFCVYDVFVTSWLTGRLQQGSKNELRELHGSYEIYKTTWLGMATFNKSKTTIQSWFSAVSPFARKLGSFNSMLRAPTFTSSNSARSFEKYHSCEAMRQC